MAEGCSSARWKDREQINGNLKRLHLKGNCIIKTSKRFFFYEFVHLILENKQWCSCRKVFAHVGCSKWLSEVYNFNNTLESGRWMGWNLFYDAQNIYLRTRSDRLFASGGRILRKNFGRSIGAFHTYAVGTTSLNLEAGGQRLLGKIIIEVFFFK